jgi:glycosyltransferase involved in cell wall biosynthesis
MLISVAIPAYNGAEHLREAIDSVLAQTYKPIEIIVVDDGSTDNTREVCESYGQALRYYYQPNDGTMGGGARARAIREASGEWIALLDQDDRWMPRKIEKQLHALSELPEAAVVFTGVQLIDSEGQVFDKSLPARPSGKVFHLLLTGNVYIASSALINRRVFVDCSPPVTDVGAADYDLWLRIARDHQVLFVDQTLTEYRVHSASYSADRKRVIMAARRALAQHKHRLHPNCSECRTSFRLGSAFFNNIAARACLDQYHNAAKSVRLTAALPLFLEATRLAPRQVLRPIQLLAASKNCALAIVIIVKKALMAG